MAIIIIIIFFFQSCCEQHTCWSVTNCAHFHLQWAELVHYILRGAARVQNAFL